MNLAWTTRTDATWFHRLRRLVPSLAPTAAAVLALVWIWVEAIELPAAEATRTPSSATAALSTLLIAYVAWVLA